jgi:hypothetical protein
MDIHKTLRKTAETVAYARNLNALKVDPETFVNAEEFFGVSYEGDTEDHLLSVRGPFVEMVPPPRKSDHTWAEFCDAMHIHPALKGAVIDVLFGGDSLGRLYFHQDFSAPWKTLFRRPAWIGCAAWCGTSRS